MAQRLEGSLKLNEILFQDPIDSFPLRDNDAKTTSVISSHASDIEALTGASPSGAEVVSARNDEADLDTRITKADEIQGDGIFEAVLNEFLVKESATPDDKVDVDTGEALINGRMVRTASVQVVDPPNFAAVSLERIDVIHVDSSGTVGSVTGTAVALGAGTAEAEQIPSNTVELARLFLRSGAANPSPFVPEDIKDTPNAADSFIVPNLQRFFVQRDNTDPHRHPANLLENGAFLRTNLAGAFVGWTATRGSFAAESTVFLFGDASVKFTGDGTAGGSFFEQALLGPESLRDKFFSFSCYLRIEDVGGNPAAVTGRITVRQVGDTPESDFSQTVVLNKETWQRVHVVGHIDNSVTGVFVRIELDTTDPSTVTGFIDGVQASVGKILTEFEYPERVRLDDDGVMQVEDLTVEGDLKVQGVADTDDALVAYLALSNTGP